MRRYIWLLPLFLLCCLAGAQAPNAASDATHSVHITTDSLSNTVVGKTYTQNLTAEGGHRPYTWVVTEGQLPKGLSLLNDGTITGTVDASACKKPPCTFNFTVKVTSAQ